MNQALLGGFNHTALLCRYGRLCQPGTTIELDKPKPYQNRHLDQKKQEKKLLLKRLVPNTVTHYNYN